MIKQTVTYKDFLKEEHTEDFYFNLTEAEVAKLELSAEGNSLRAWTEKIVKANRGADIIDTFEKIIDASYGERVNEGRNFRKSPEILADFKSSNAYSALWMTLATDAKRASDFINGVVPENFNQASQNGAGAASPEQVRKNSEEIMHGFRRPQQKEENPMTVVPSIPAEEPVLQAAPPVLEQPAMNAEQLPPVSPQTTQVDVNSMSVEQLREFAMRQQTTPQVGNQ
jgi:hypothetical protein